MPKSWDELTDKERESVQLILFSLKEFSYGVDATEAAAAEVVPGAAKLRFYITSLNHYFSSYFLVGGANKLRNRLEQIGSSDLLRPIEELLEIKLGDMKVSEIMRTWRDKFLTHQTFSTELLSKKIHKKADFHSGDNAERYTAIVSELFRRTQDYMWH